MFFFIFVCKLFVLHILDLQHPTNYTVLQTSLVELHVDGYIIHNSKIPSCTLIDHEPLKNQISSQNYNNIIAE